MWVLSKFWLIDSTLTALIRNHHLLGPIPQVFRLYFLRKPFHESSRETQQSWALLSPKNAASSHECQSEEMVCTLTYQSRELSCNKA